VYPDTCDVRAGYLPREQSDLRSDLEGAQVVVARGASHSQAVAQPWTATYACHILHAGRQDDLGVYDALG
jgi:hypothetical protein